MARAALNAPSSAGSTSGRSGGKAKSSSGRKAGGKKSGGRKGKRVGRRSTSSGASRSTSLTNQLLALGLDTAKIAVPGALASAAHGYFGQKMMLGGKIDARLAAVAGALVVQQFAKPSASTKEMINKGIIGVLGSWMNEKAFEVGDSRAAPAAAPAAETTPATQGVVLGNIYDGDGSGAFWQSAEKRLAKKLAKAKKTAEKKGIDWSEVREEAEDIAEKKGWGGQYGPDRSSAPVGRQVVVAPGPMYAAPAVRRRVVLPRFFRFRRPVRAR